MGWLVVSLLLAGEPMNAITLHTGQTTLEALEVSRLRVQAYMQTYKENPCKRTLEAWEKAQDVASDMMLLHLRLLNLQDAKVKEDSVVADWRDAVAFALSDNDIIESYDIVGEEDIICEQ
jgi:hypothetical protein